MGVDCKRFLTILKNIPLFLWSVKSLFLVPWDIYTDVTLAFTHLKNGHKLWGGLTVTFLLPSLMLPFHYYSILKFAVTKFKVLFRSSIPTESEQKLLLTNEQQVVFYDGMLAYFEDIPPFILQVYILWKTPLECFSLDGDWENDEIVAVQSILTSFLSISATVVPFYEKNEDKEWTLISGPGLQSFLTGTFMHVIPKLVLTAWTFSVLNWYGWFFIAPLFFISCFMACRNGAGDIDITFLHIVPSIQILFGYPGKKRTYISALMLTSFLIPLGIALHAAVNTSEAVDFFQVFPSDPFPSRVICFTNSSTKIQEELWQNKTTYFSNNCNKTYSAVPCDFGLGQGQRNIIIGQLSAMIVISVGVLILLTLIIMMMFCKCIFYWIFCCLACVSNPLAFAPPDAQLFKSSFL